MQKNVSPQLFGELLSKAIYKIKMNENKNISSIYWELGLALGKSSGSIIQYYRRGNIPSSEETIKNLVLLLFSRRAVNSDEAKQLLDSAGYNKTIEFIEQNEIIEIKEKLLSIFLCHSSYDKKNVRDLYNKLRNQGFAPWLDEKNLLPGQDWEKEIQIAVNTCDVVLVCLSQNSVNKQGYIHKEIKFALDVADQQPEGVIFLIPVRLDDCIVPIRLQNLHWVNLFDDDGFDKLLKSLQLRTKELNK